VPWAGFFFPQLSPPESRPVFFGRLHLVPRSLHVDDAGRAGDVPFLSFSFDVVSRRSFFLQLIGERGLFWKRSFNHVAQARTPPAVMVLNSGIFHEMRRSASFFHLEPAFSVGFLFAPEVFFSILPHSETNSCLVRDP